MVSRPYGEHNNIAVASVLALLLGVSVAATQGLSQASDDMSTEPTNAAARRRLRLRQEAAAAASAPTLVLAIEGPSFSSLDFSPPAVGSEQDTTTTTPTGVESRYVRDTETKRGNRFRIAQVPIYLQPAESSSLENEAHEVRTANSVWDCAVVVSKFLEFAQQLKKRPGIQITSNTRIIELGSGTGLAGIAAATLLADAQRIAVDSSPTGMVTLTDVSEVVPSLGMSILANKMAQGSLPVEAKSLDWTKLDRDVPKISSPFDIIIAADVVWVERLIEPFVNALIAISNNKTTVLFAYQTRSNLTTKKLFDMLSDVFTIVEVENDEFHPKFSQRIGVIQVYLLVRKGGGCGRMRENIQ